MDRLGASSVGPTYYDAGRGVADAAVAAGSWFELLRLLGALRALEAGQVRSWCASHLVGFTLRSFEERPSRVGGNDADVWCPRRARGGPQNASGVGARASDRESAVRLRRW